MFCAARERIIVCLLARCQLRDNPCDSILERLYLHRVVVSPEKGGAATTTPFDEVEMLLGNAMANANVGLSAPTDRA